MIAQPPMVKIVVPMPPVEGRAVSLVLTIFVVVPVGVAFPTVIVVVVAVLSVRFVTTTL